VTEIFLAIIVLLLALVIVPDVVRLVGAVILRVAAFAVPVLVLWLALVLFN